MLKNIFLFCSFLTLISCSTSQKIDMDILFHNEKEAYKRIENLDLAKEQNLALWYATMCTLVLKDNTYLPLLEKKYETETKTSLNEVHFAKILIEFLSLNPNYELVLHSLSNEKKIPEKFQKISVLLKAICYFYLKDYESSIAYLNAYEGKKDFSFYFFKGASLFYLKDYVRSEESFNEILNFKKNVSQNILSLTYVYLGKIFEIKKENKKAFEYFIKAVNLHPKNSELYYQLALFLQRCDQNHLASRFFQTSLRIDNNNANAWFYLNLN